MRLILTFPNRTSTCFVDSDFELSPTEHEVGLIVEALPVGNSVRIGSIGNHLIFGPTILQPVVQYTVKRHNRSEVAHGNQPRIDCKAD